MTSPPVYEKARTFGVRVFFVLGGGLAASGSMPDTGWYVGVYCVLDLKTRLTMQINQGIAARVRKSVSQ